MGTQKKKKVNPRAVAGNAEEEEGDSTVHNNNESVQVCVSLWP